MSDLVEFLLARIAEDEQAACTLIDPGPVKDWELEHPELALEKREAARSELLAREPGAWLSHRVRAECEAKRKLIAICDEADDHPNALLVRGRVLAGLALPYADHEQFQEEWRP